jgi:hypothetical protein
MKTRRLLVIEVLVAVVGAVLITTLLSDAVVEASHLLASVPWPGRGAGSALVHCAGVEAEQAVGRAEAERAGDERHDADVAPGADHVGDGQPDEQDADAHAKRAIGGTYVDLHEVHP